MRPLDPRLLRWATSTRRFLVVAVALGVITAVLVVAQAWLITDIVIGGFQEGRDVEALTPAFLALAAIVGVRALVVWASEWAAARTGARAKRELRSAVVDAVVVNGQGTPASPSATAALVTRGIDALDGYYARYLPQLVLAVIVPVVILGVVVGQDVLSAVIIAITLPLIPVFMVLVGLYTRGRVDRQWRALNRLNGQFLDFVEGLPTLMVFGRAKAQAAALRNGGERYRSMTMGVLRVSFLSSLVLELLAAIAVALVAVEIGLRLVSGGLTLSTGLFVLILAPEAYLPLRLVGTHYHSAAEGLGAADEVITLLEEAEHVDSEAIEVEDVPTDLGGVEIQLSDLTVMHLGRTTPSVQPLTLTIAAGSCLAVVGTSGAGKSTLLEVLAGERKIASGTCDVVLADGRRVPLASLPPDAWRRHAVLVSQRPRLVDPTDLANAAPTIRSVLLGADSSADEAAMEEALRTVDLIEPLVARGDRLGAVTPVGALSAGQQRRVALARAHLSGASLILLDEPSAGVDPQTEQSIVATISRWRAQGRTVVVVAHRPAVLEVADAVVRLDASSLEQRRRQQHEVAGVLSAPSDGTARDVLEVGW